MASKTNIKVLIPLALICFAFIINVYPQSSCTNVDFSMGNFTHWNGYYGFYNTLSHNYTPGIIPGRHTIISSPGYDPRTGNALNVLPPGKDIGARLGVWVTTGSVPGYSEKLSYTLSVHEDYTLFLYSYAVVLEDINHPPDHQPKFIIRVLDASANIIDPVCGYYSVVASANIPGFQNFGDVRWKDWTTVAIDLSNYIGEDITIEYTSYDCQLGDHFGYAYLSAECLPMQIVVQFCENSDEATLTAPDGFVSYTWTPGDFSGQTITIENPVPGDQYFCFMESHVDGCAVTLSTNLEEIIIIPDFNFEFATGCEIVFEDQSGIVNDEIVYWLWDFGDGITNTLQNPAHNYINSGIYNVELTVVSSHGCSGSVTYTLEFNLPEPDFGFESFCAGDTLIFINNSMNASASDIVSWHWNFNDGNVGEGQIITHVFENPGVHQVKLSVETALGCFAEISKDVMIYYNPIADFNYENVCIGDEVVFVNTSTIGSNETLHHKWVMGDGTVYSNTQDVLHTFSSTGTFDVMLMVSTVYECHDQITIPVTIHPLPLVDFSADRTEGCPPLTVQFNNLSEPGEYTWNFGNSYIKAGQSNLQQIYDESGLYDISLTVISEHGCVNTKVKSGFIQVFTLPKASFKPKPLIACGNKPEIEFTDRSTDAVQWTWNFGDEESVDNEFTGPGPAKHIFTGLGEYEVNLIVTNEFGCTHDISEKVYILPGKDSFLPNAFNPGGEYYTHFRPMDPDYEISGFSMQIFDRWGGEVFRSKDIVTGWDGTDARTGRKALQGVYSYIVFVTIYGVSEKYVGSVTVVY